MAIQNMEAYQVSPFSVGMDLNRSQIKEALGNYVVDTTTPTTIRSGMLVQLNTTTQKIEVCTGAAPFGFAKFNRTTDIYGMVVGEYIKLDDTTAKALAHNNLFDSGVSSIFTCRVGAALTGTPYIQDTDFTCNEANGTIVRLGAGIVNHSYVYVNYMFKLSTSDLNIYGQNFWNSADDAAYQASRYTVVTDWALIFTTQYDPSATFTAGQILYAGRSSKAKSGLVCADSTEGNAVIGRCFQIPTANDPFLGIKYVGGMVS